MGTDGVISKDQELITRLIIINLEKARLIGHRSKRTMAGNRMRLVRLDILIIEETRVKTTLFVQSDLGVFDEITLVASPVDFYRKWRSVDECHARLSVKRSIRSCLNRIASLCPRNIRGGYADQPNKQERSKLKDYTDGVHDFIYSQLAGPNNTSSTR